MKKIQLTQGQVSILDEEEYTKFSVWKWHAAWNSCTQSFYARRNSKTVNGKRHFIFLHREILGLDWRDPRRGDHKDGNTLNNQKINLRPATASENNCNTRIYSNNKSGMKGVYFNKGRGHWTVSVQVHKKSVWGGAFYTFDAACLACSKLREKLHGEFARAA